MRNAARRLAVIPFETAVALLLAASGAAGLAGVGVIDPVAALLPHLEAVVLYAMTAVTGVLMITGTATARRGPETAGLLFLIGVVAARFLLYGVYLGFGADFAVTGVFYSAIIGAAVARLHTVRKRLVLVQVKQDGWPADAGD